MTKTVLVTGGTRGIGYATALLFAENGYHVVVSYLKNRDLAEDVKREIEAKNGSVLCIQSDIRDPVQVEALVDEAHKKYQSLDVVIGNAGIQVSASVSRTTDADWDAVIGTNLSGPFYLSRAALRCMGDGGGSIVHVASASSFMGHAGASAYVASKHGLIGLVKVLALEGVKRGIRVNAVAPGVIDTDLVRGLTDEQKNLLLKRVPMGRMASAMEVAEMIYWVATQATYSTGNVFHAGGGVVMG